MTRHALSYQQVVEFAADELGDQEAAVVAAHVASCAECAATVARYRAVRKALRSTAAIAPPVATIARAKAIFPRRPSHPPLSRPVEVVKRGIARLAFDSRSGLALSGVRGAGSTYHVMYEGDLADVDLQVERLPEREGGAWQIVGQVAVDEPLSHVVVALVPSDAVLPTAEVEADEYGVFTVRAQEGRYDLHIRLTSALMIVPDLEIG